MAIVSAADRDPVPGPPPDEGPVPGALRFRRYPWPIAATLAVALWLSLPGMTGAQSVPAFTGRYRFVLRVSPSCPPGMQVGPVSVVMDVVEVRVSAGSEVSGQSASPSEVPDNGRFVLLRQGNRLHGAFGAHTQYFGLETEGIYRVWMQVMTDGVATTSSIGRARASGTAFGEVELGLAGDPTGTPIDNGKGNCGFATTGHEWSLEPA
jgi:hypothetical protein